MTCWNQYQTGKQISQLLLYFDW